MTKGKESTAKKVSTKDKSDNVVVPFRDSSKAKVSIDDNRVPILNLDGISFLGENLEVARPLAYTGPPVLAKSLQELTEQVAPAGVSKGKHTIQDSNGKIESLTTTMQEVVEALQVIEKRNSDDIRSKNEAIEQLLESTEGLRTKVHNLQLKSGLESTAKEKLATELYSLSSQLKQLTSEKAILDKEVTKLAAEQDITKVSFMELDKEKSIVDNKLIELTLECVQNTAKMQNTEADHQAKYAQVSKERDDAICEGQETNQSLQEALTKIDGLQEYIESFNVTHESKQINLVHRFEEFATAFREDLTKAKPPKAIPYEIKKPQSNTKVLALTRTTLVTKGANQPNLVHCLEEFATAAREDITKAKPPKAIPYEIKKPQSNTKVLALTRTTLVTKRAEPPNSGVGLVRTFDATEDTIVEPVAKKAETSAPTTSADKNSHEMQVSEDAIVEPVAKKAETSAPTPAVCPPIVGERFWIKFQRKEKDRFGCTASSWFVGTAITVKKVNNSKKILFSIKVKYEDETKEVLDFPSELVWRLQAEPGTTIFNALSCHCTKQKTRFAYDSSPKELHAGDLVDCNYQNGDSHGFWYRGRVACDSADKFFFDVAYEDGEFECGIPIEGDNFRLIKRGIDNCKWMVGLSIVEKFNPEKKKSTRKGFITKIERSEDDGSVFFKIQFSDSSSESWPYADAMQTLFESEREASFYEYKHIKCWPQTVLHVGDLVHGYFQNGSPHNVWHRGRIAAISDDQTKYDVCYDDNDKYECGMPIEKVRLFRQHKMDASSWVCGMDIVVEPRHQKRKRKGSVEKSERTPTCTDSFQVNFSDGTCESMTYMKIATAWFAEQYDIRSRKKPVTSRPSTNRKRRR